MPVRIRLLALAASCLAFASHAALAQSVIVTNGPASNNTIPLAPNSSVEFDVNGDLKVTCALNANSVCAPLAGTVTPGGAPTVTLTRTDNNTDVKTGQNVALSWTSTNAEACRSYTTSPNSAATLWESLRESSGSATVPVSAVGTYSFELQCFNANGGSTKPKIDVAVTQSELPVEQNNCTLTGPMIQPAGWTRTNKTWTQAATWPNGQNNNQVYPELGGSPVPWPVNKGGYVTIPFVAGVAEAVNITWDQPQASLLTGYQQPKPGNLYFSVSPCPGDFRAADFGASGDSFLQFGCRKGPAAAGGLTWHTLDTPSNSSACQLVAGNTYYVNVIAADPNDGLQAGEHTCASQTSSSCEVTVKR